jgi:hypothetical protein
MQGVDRLLFQEESVNERAGTTRIPVVSRRASRNDAWRFLFEVETVAYGGRGSGVYFFLNLIFPPMSSLFGLRDSSFIV